jgi:hypothetical protein
MTSFAFLDGRRLLISAFTDFQPELRVLDIQSPQTDMSGYFFFRLPELSHDFEGISDIDMTIQTEPPTSWAADSHPDEPFTTCHSDRLFVVSLRGWETLQRPEPTFMLCVRLSTLLNLIENPPDDTVDCAIAWDQWGPSGTRMLRVSQLPDPWVCFVYGQRCVIQTTPTRCKILDFNPLSTSPNRILHEKSVDKRRRMFLHPVTTSAPFALLSVEVSPSAAVMLAEDGIVTVSASLSLWFAPTDRALTPS